MTESNLGLEILQEVTRIANSTLDLDETLEKIILVIKNKMHMDACAIYLINESDGLLHLKASMDLPKKAKHINLEMGQGVTGWVAQHGTSLALSEAMQDPRFVYFPEIEEEKFSSMLSVPILADCPPLGVINVHSIETRTFSLEETSVLETIAGQVTGCLKNAMQFHQNQMTLKETRILYEISLAVQSTLKLEHGLWIILSAITMGEAGGFNRAMLFTLDEKNNLLQGIMGLGPDSHEDAVRIWTELDKKKGDLLQWAIREAQHDLHRDSNFHNFVCGLRYAIAPNDNILSETVLQKKPFNITKAKEHPLVSQEFYDALGVDSFATVPLIAHEEVLGVILVDNRYDQKPITEENLRFLTRFTVYASWVIENSRLFSKLLDTNRELLSMKEQLVQAERLSALGEMAAEVAHEIKNPLVSIGGFARRLKDKMTDLSQKWEDNKDLKSASKYSEIISSETDRLERLLKNTLIYSKSGALETEKSQLNKLVEEALYLFKAGLYEKNINLVTHLESNLPLLDLDQQKIKQVLINLFYNALESLSLGGLLKVETFLEEYAQKQKMITVRVEDTGGGIPQEVFENIFNPFFTTKHSGTGLGLSICRKIIENHGGTIRVENQLGKGVTVYLHLPLQNPPDYYKN
ncbi:MAG: GAF domain-containing protein [Nitrospinae bacterium]|nr:GAF domain-containing protein [Nitrospinota bacterium]